MTNQKMHVIEMNGTGGPEVLKMAQQDIVRPAYGEVLIKLDYAGVNRPDLLQRAGLYAPPKGASPILGLEGAGEIAALGGGVTDWQIGDKVCALFPGGAYAQYATARAAHCLPIPRGMDMKAAACLPETFFTVWSNVFMRGGLQAGELFMVHGGTSGIGTTAIQLARAFGARVVATAGSDEKCDMCESLGAGRAINYKSEVFEQVVQNMGGADVILDMVGGDYMARNLRALADDGRLVQIAYLQGPKRELNLMHVMTRRLTITGSTLRPQSDLAKAKIAQALRAKVWPLIELGRVAPVIDRSFALADAAQAHAYMDEGVHMGKVVLEI